MRDDSGVLKEWQPRFARAARATRNLPEGRILELVRRSPDRAASGSGWPTRAMSKAVTWRSSSLLEGTTTMPRRRDLSPASGRGSSDWRPEGCAGRRGGHGNPTIVTSGGDRSRRLVASLSARRNVAAQSSMVAWPRTAGRAARFAAGKCRDRLLANSTNPVAAACVTAVQDAARAIGLHLHVLKRRPAKAAIDCSACDDRRVAHRGPDRSPILSSRFDGSR